MADEFARICAALETNDPFFTELHLQSDKILSEEGCKRLGEAISCNNFLKKIFLAPTGFNGKCYEHLFKGIGMNKIIEFLRISHFDVTHEAKMHIESNFKLNTSIKTLDFMINKNQDEQILSVLPRNLQNLTLGFSPNMKTDCQLKDFCECLKTHSSLTEFRLHEFKGDLANIHCLASALECNTTLRRLALDFGIMNAEKWGILFDALKNNKGIERILLALNRAEDMERVIFELAEFLEKNTTLESINLTHNELGTKNNCTTLVHALQNNEILTKLDLSDNKIDDFQELGKLMMNPLNNLSILNIGWNTFSAENSKFFLDCLSKNKKLQSLNVGCSKMDSECLGLFGEFFAQKDANSALTELDLTNPEVEVSETRSFFENLIKNKSLKKLEIGGSITINNGEFVGKLLRNNSNLEFLNIYSSEINAQDSKFIFDALKTNSRLTYLDMCDNSIGNEGAFECADMLKHNKSLKTLILLQNQIDFEGVRSILEAIRKNTTIKK